MSLVITRMIVVPVDKACTINGQLKVDIDMSSLPSNLHAMQWYDTWGEEEYDNGPGQPKPPNVRIENLDDYQTVIQEWEAAPFPPNPLAPVTP